MVPEQPTKGEKAENGLVEVAGKTIRKYTCTVISQIEEGIGEDMDKDSPIFIWIVRWAAICYSRYAVGRDWRTAYERLRGITCKAVVVPMGEKVVYRRLRAGVERQHKA